jgi:uncharacterized membrane protein
MPTILSSAPASDVAAAHPASPVPRIQAIDALRGVVILLMLVDHAREFFFLDHQVGDPMDVATTSPALFASRLAAHLCAPVFVLLTGLAAWLYGAGRGRAVERGASQRSGGDASAASAFLFKRGLILVVLEWSVVNFAWTFDPTPPTIFLQVIWAIGLSMIVLAALIHLPRRWLVVLALALMLGHNLLDRVTVPAGQPGHAWWAVLHQRDYVDLPWGARARTSYPVLPWIGVIAFGYALGPWFARDADPVRRRRLLLVTATASIALFVILRSINGYGDPHPWAVGHDASHTVMSFLNVTKYPPSADFLLLTLGVGLALLALLELGGRRWSAILSVFGSAPLFFYLLHLYLLHAGNRLIGVATGHGDALVSVPDVWGIWVIAAIVAVPCWFACRAFAAAKRQSGAWWMRYL